MATHYLNTKPKQTFTSNQSEFARQLLIINVLVVDYLYGDESLFFEHEPMDMYT